MNTLDWIHKTAETLDASGRIWTQGCSNPHAIPARIFDEAWPEAAGSWRRACCWRSPNNLRSRERAMIAKDFVYIQTKRHIMLMGWTEHQAEDVAALALERYRQNRFERATDFLDFAVKHAKQNYGDPPKKRKS